MTACSWEAFGLSQTSETSDWESSLPYSCWSSISTAKSHAKVSLLVSGYCVETSISSKDVTSSTVTSSKVSFKILSWVMEFFCATNGSSDTVWSSSISEKPVFLKQFCMVFSRVNFCYQLLQLFFGLLYFCTLLLKNEWALDPLLVRRKSCLEEEKNVTAMGFETKTT